MSLRSDVAQCKATTKSGGQCKNKAREDGYCHIESHGGRSQASHSRARYNPDKIAELIVESDGNLSDVARRIGCSRRTIHNYCNKYEQCAQARDEARQGFVDLAEKSLRNLVAEGDFKAVRFALRCWGRDRGWNEKIELEHSGPDGDALDITVTFASDE